MAERWIRIAVAAAYLLVGLPAVAAADWYFTPFVGWDFKASTTLYDFDFQGTERTKFTFGGSAAFIHGIFGVEADYAYVPGFFNSKTMAPGSLTSSNGVPAGKLIASSRVQTLTGNFMVTTPLSLTRESLRPYAAVGIGWMDANAVSALPVQTHLTAINFGFGAYGMLSDHTGVRFDLRRFNNIDRDLSSASIGPAQLSFWRGTVGFVIKP